MLWSGARVVHLSWSTNLGRRLKRLLALGPGQQEAKGSLRQSIDAVECWTVGSRLEMQIVLHRLAKRQYPDKYVKLLKLRMPWFLQMTGQDRFPRLDITNRVPRAATALLGPFVSKTAAVLYEQQSTGLFQLRRCTETLAPSPEHPGCIYGEMNQCLRPCQCAVSEDEYGSEAQRVLEFLETNGRSAKAALVTARTRAAEAMEFEQASALHRRIEEINEAAALRDAVIEDVQSFAGVALTRGAAPGELVLWLMREGCWQKQIPLTLLGREGNTKSMDREIRDLVGQAWREQSGDTGACAESSEAERSTEQAEQLAIFSRWYYSSWRDGEWFGFRDPGGLNYRKLVREISKMTQALAAEAT